MKKLVMGSMVAACACLVVAGCGSKPKTADQAVMNAVKGVQNNQPQVLFESLPASYQQDINSLVSDAAKKMDKEVWDAGTGLLKQVQKILETKKDILLQSQLVGSNPDMKDEISKNYDQGVEMLGALIKSDFLNLDVLRKGDVEKLLSGSGAKLMKKAKKLQTPASKELDKLKTVVASLVSQDGDTAKVKIEAKDEDPETIDFVRVEGKWIPKDMADEFTEKIKEARENLTKMDFTTEDGKKVKAQILQQISMISTMLSKAETAKTKEEMDGVLMGVMMGVAATAMQHSGDGAPAMPPAPPTTR